MRLASNGCLGPVTPEEEGKKERRKAIVRSFNSLVSSYREFIDSHHHHPSIGIIYVCLDGCQGPSLHHPFISYYLPSIPLGTSHHLASPSHP